MEATLAEVFGPDATISRTTASRICQRLQAEFDIWKRRDLQGTRIDYLFLDGSFFKMHPRAEPVLVAWGIDTCGKPAFLGLAPGAPSRPMPGGRCWPTWATVGWAPRCW